MSKLKICRICLQTETKMYKFDRYHLMQYYEEVISHKVNEVDGLPQYFCYECAALLHKFHKFKEKCYIGQKILQQLQWKGPITYQRINKIDRPRASLTSSLGVLRVSKKVKTLNTSRNIKVKESSESESDQEDKAPDKYKFSACNEPEIYLEMLKPFNDTKIGSETGYSDIKPPLSDEDEPKPPLSDTDEPAIADDDDIEMENKGPSSPPTVFIDKKKKNVKVKSEPVKKAKKTTVAIGEPAKKYKFKKQTKPKKINTLDPKHWKKVVLSEEEAMKQFRARAEDAKYTTFEYKCLDCFKGFTKEDIWKRHRLRRHNESLPLECRFCHTRFKWPTHVRQHMREHFNRFECLRCGLVCPLETTTLLHDDYHNGVKKKCKHCNKEFTHFSTYYTHLRTHRSEYVCPLCGVSFVSQVGLQVHQKRKHVNNETVSPEDAEKANTFCERCDIRFESKKAYDEHLFHSAMHHGGEITQDEPKDDSSILRKILGEDEKPKNTERKSLKNISKPETSYAKKGNGQRIPRKPTDCYQCGAHFETLTACIKHHTKEHPRTSFTPTSQRHICEICGASLAPGSVASHINMHTKEKKYECGICGRSFYASVSLWRHRLTHSDEKPVGCPLCDKRFKIKDSMMLHYRTFHLKQPYPKRNRNKKDEPQTAD